MSTTAAIPVYLHVRIIGKGEIQIPLSTRASQVFNIFFFIQIFFQRGVGYITYRKYYLDFMGSKLPNGRIELKLDCFY